MDVVQQYLKQRKTKEEISRSSNSTLTSLRTELNGGGEFARLTTLQGVLQSEGKQKSPCWCQPYLFLNQWELLLSTKWQLTLITTRSFKTSKSVESVAGWLFHVINIINNITYFYEVITNIIHSLQFFLEHVHKLISSVFSFNVDKSNLFQQLLNHILQEINSNVNNTHCFMFLSRTSHYRWVLNSVLIDNLPWQASTRCH